MRPRAVLVFALAPALGACGLTTAGLLDATHDASVAADASGGDATLGAGEAAAGDDAAGIDAAVDSPATADASDAAVPPVDSGPCLGLTCNGGCLADASDCRACDGGPLLCAATHACGASCAACADRPILCFDCDSNRENPVGTCEPFDAGSYCINGGIYPNYHCECANKNDPTDCPGATHVCGDIGAFTIACMTCGEQGTDGLACRGGGACDESKATCK